jgi:hypothetical protein
MTAKQTLTPAASSSRQRRSVALVMPELNAPARPRSLVMTTSMTFFSARRWSSGCSVSASSSLVRAATELKTS